MRYIFICLLVSLIFGCSAISNIAKQSEDDFSSECLTLLLEKQYSNLARKFHFPVTRPALIETDFYQDIEAQLHKHISVYGEIEVIEKLDKNKSYLVYKTNIGTSSHEKYWRHERVSNNAYKVNFGSFGGGYLIFSISDRNDTFELKEVKFGIHVKSPGAKEKFNRIISQLK